MSKLKPCPFCGGEADLRIYDPPFVPQMQFYVACTNCGAMTHPCNLYKERAIALWNRRQNKEDKR